MDDFRKSIPNVVPYTDRIWTTEIGSYNQVIALTQWMINTGIQNFYTYLKTNGKLPKPATIAPNPNEALSNAVFGPPAVMIEASTANFTSVKLHLTLQSGVAKVIQKYEAPSEANDNKQLLEIAYLKMKDMHVIVPCNIDFIDLNPNSDRGKEMKARMNAGDHSIYQLLVNLASAAWGDAVWDYGVWTNDDTVTVDASNGMPPQQRKPDGWVLGEKRDRAQLGTSLITHMEAMFKTLSRQFTEKGMLTMNYVKKFDIPTRKPTFDVNDTRLQTYPWVDAANNPVTPGLTGPGRLNYLCYLETVGTNTPPALSDKNVILSPFVNGARRGNWTDGVDPKQDAPTKFGNFVLSSTCFLEGYFLPKLENLNRLMRLDLDSVDCDITAEFASWQTTTSYTVAVGREYNGQNVPSSSDFQFKRSIFSVGNDWDGETKDWYKDWSESLPRGTLEYGWSWVHRHEKDKTNRYKHIGSVEEWTWGQTFTETRVLIVPGTSKILYHGKSWTKVNYKIDPSIIESNVSGGFIVTAKWHIIFTMKELSNGGLYFDIDTSPIEVNVPWNSDGESDPWPNAIKSQYENAGNNFEFVVNGLRTALNETQTFIMPSSGVYFFKNPIFNHAGDLICELEYNGIGNDGSPPVNSDGVMDPNIAKPDFKDFERAVTADGSQLTF